MNNPPPPPHHQLYGGLAPPGLPGVSSGGQYPSLQPNLFYPGTIPPLTSFTSKYQPTSQQGSTPGGLPPPHGASLFPPPMYSNALMPSSTTSAATGKLGGFAPSAFGSLPFNTQPTTTTTQFKRTREEQDEDEEEEEEEEEESEEIHSFPPPPTSKQIPQNNLRSATAPALPQFMPTQQQYSKQPPPPLPKMNVPPPPQPSIANSLASSNITNTNTSTSSSKEQQTKEKKPKKQPKPKKSKKDQSNNSDQASNVQSNNNNNTSNTNNNNSSSSTTTTNTTINTTLPPVLNIYGPFTSAANALFGNDLMYDESIRKLGQFIFSLSETDNIELEGKVGYLIVKDRKQRMIPQLTNGSHLLSEVIVHRSKDCEFQSRIPPEIFKYVNNLLNERYSSLQDLKKKKQYNGPIITYGRCNETDKFYEYYLPPSEDDVRNEEGELDHRDIRVTFDTETDKPIRAMIKSRLENGDIDFSCPHRVHDFRISFRREKKIDRFPDLNVDKPKKIRRKSRISYTFGICRIDLTSVESFNCHKNGEIIESTKLSTFEIEVECDTRVIFQSKSRLFDLVNYLKEFLDIVRMLCLICEQHLPNSINNNSSSSSTRQPPPPVPMVANNSSRTASSSSHHQQHQQQQYGNNRR
ncbi:predicted protein [Naegleria gruberi]|uniref:mRNA 5'-phosphatase n=1 Tax=Naegleria gruberi TaxID=5762 RepID=D2W4B7_NAEGR|nr:uncharacterized protein NAEGRDRAFT_54582 [Naegleria gruberi]EFC36089.1 predicted protein [Naegleria gruberi]|eukprot:XP_002668833.1 predicted protein [Naegleria gruberi strain NEG-M]